MRQIVPKVKSNPYETLLALLNRACSLRQMLDLEALSLPLARPSIAFSRFPPVRVLLRRNYQIVSFLNR
jgi:hypothetical protein